MSSFAKMLFSPFDALGLNPGIYEQSAIDKAFRRASLVCHPDKRKFPEERWPSLHHLQEARTFLWSSCKEASYHFDSYPRTFFPERPSEAYFQSPILSKDFCRCLYCQVVVRIVDLPEHLQSHGAEICHICGDVLLSNEKRVHLESHSSEACTICSDILDAGSQIMHNMSFHTCPLCHVDGLVELSSHLISSHLFQACKAELCQTSRVSSTHVGDPRFHSWETCVFCFAEINAALIRGHITNDHFWRPCADCNTNYDQPSLNHVETVHTAIDCPVCSQSVDHTGLLLHLLDIHAYQRCYDCPSDLNLHHIAKDHQWEVCTECKDIKSVGQLPQHLCSVHGWLKCRTCEQATPNEETLVDHVTDHQLIPCSYCYLDVAQEQYRSHMRDEHHLKECPFCDKIGDSLFLKGHLKENHNDINDCKVCGDPQAEGMLHQHLIDSHFWEKCHFCDHVDPSYLLEDHTKQKHDPRPCPACDKLHAATELPLHLAAEHSHRSCPFCSFVGELSTHIFDCHQPSQDANKRQHPRTKSLTFRNQLAELLQSWMRDPQEPSDFDKSLKDAMLSTILPLLNCESQSRPESDKDESGQQCEEDGRRARSGSHCPTDQPAGSTIIDAHGMQSSELAHSADLRSGVPSINKRKRPRPGTIRDSMTERRLSQITERHWLKCYLDKKSTLLGFFRATKDLKFDLNRIVCFQSVPGEILVRASTWSSLHRSLEGHTDSTKLLSQLSLLLLARDVNLSKTRDARLRADSSEIDRILHHQRLPVNGPNRRRLNTQVSRGRKLDKLCSYSDGILCFMALGTTKTYFDLTTAGKEQELKEFVETWKDYADYCAAGEALVNGVKNGNLPNFAFEGKSDPELEQMDQSSLRALLEVV